NDIDTGLGPNGRASARTAISGREAARTCISTKSSRAADLNVPETCPRVASRGPREALPWGHERDPPLPHRPPRPRSRPFSPRQRARRGGPARPPVAGRRAPSMPRVPRALERGRDRPPRLAHAVRIRPTLRGDGARLRTREGLRLLPG